MLAAVFQLAHCVGEAEFLGSGRVETDWAEHQVATTVDFAPKSSLLGWYLGGLNFQVEHHLFPRVCHLHYPALARIVEETCRACPACGLPDVGSEEVQGRASCGRRSRDSSLSPLRESLIEQVADALEFFLGHVPLAHELRDEERCRTVKDLVDDLADGATASVLGTLALTHCGAAGIYGAP